jgi:hypothetical protein
VGIAHHRTLRLPWLAASGSLNFLRSTMTPKDLLLVLSVTLVVILIYALFFVAA